MNQPTDRQGGEGAAAVTHALSIDVEDYRQILSARFRGEPGPLAPEFERNMEAVLDLLDAAGVKATFFVIGTVARERPDLVRRWADLGHEIASHGPDHTPVWAVGRERLLEHLVGAKRALQDAAGRAVAGYRAPVFSIRWDTLWALEVVRDAGFTYDSSIVPVRLRRYGVAGFDPRPRVYGFPSGAEIVEIPISTARVCGLRVPVAGGGYFRLFSYRRIRRAVAEVEREGRPFVVYAHPDEFGPERFRVADMATGCRDKVLAGMIALKSNLGRRKVPETLRRLLAEFRFSTLGRLAERVAAEGPKGLLPGLTGAESRRKEAR